MCVSGGGGGGGSNTEHVWCRAVMPSRANSVVLNVVQVVLLGLGLELYGLDSQGPLCEADTAASSPW